MNSGSSYTMGMGVIAEKPPLDSELAVYMEVQEMRTRLSTPKSVRVFPSSPDYKAHLNVHQPEMLLFPQSTRDVMHMALLTPTTDYRAAFAEITGARSVDGIQMALDDKGVHILEFVFDDDAVEENDAHMNSRVWELFHLTIYGTVGMVRLTVPTIKDTRLLPLSHRFVVPKGFVDNITIGLMVKTLSTIILAHKQFNTKISDRLEGSLFLSSEDTETRAHVTPFPICVPAAKKEPTYTRSSQRINHMG